MPELPEVETIRQQLQKYLIGHRIEEVEVRFPKVFSGERQYVKKATVKNIRRFGKALSIDLSNGYSIVIHIKLTGQLIYRGPNLKFSNEISPKVISGINGKHTHVVFHLDKGGRLYYNDLRRFGWIKVIKTSKLKTESEFVGKLGPEPLIDSKNPPENILTLEKFKEILSKTSRPIKVVLMDQEKIAGIGNIYANDALWLAKIHPKAKANKLNGGEVEKLFEAVREVLKQGLRWGGASELMYVTPDGKEGKYQEHTLVYAKEGEPCSRCHKSKIKKFFLSGRGTYFCPVCQILKNS